MKVRYTPSSGAVLRRPGATPTGALVYEAEINERVQVYAHETRPTAVATDVNALKGE